MNTLPDVTNLTATEVGELMKQCSERLQALRQQAIQQAELLGLHCALPDGKPRKKRNSKHADAS